MAAAQGSALDPLGLAGPDPHDVRKAGHLRRILGGGLVALLLMVAVVLAVFAASRMGEWTNPFSAPYRSAAGPR